MSARTLAAERPDLAERRASLHRLLQRKSAVSTWFVVQIAFASAVWVAFVSLLDAGCFFELGYGLRVIAAAVYVASPVIVFVRARWVQAIVGSSLVWMLLVLPHVRWNHAKSFYVDARRIDAGMTVAEVRDIMRSYLEVRGGVAVDGDGRVRYQPSPEEQERGPWIEERDDFLLFLHSVEGYTDACEVDLDPRGTVLEVRTVKD